MSEGFLSQEEIDALLRGEPAVSVPEPGKRFSGSDHEYSVCVQ